MSDKHTFQSIILKLQQYWAEKGCVIWQPYYTQVGAGTMNPATFLKVLGPDAWNVAYVEPSVRPDDGRYGENPNRLQMHYQFQVILKPDPGNPQELYLESLRAIGIDPRKHDIRFVEDNWEQPAISAWGLGWEVWLDGQEITQFTYFQQVGGIALDPVAVEITYGLDRILIALNDAPSIWNEPWSEDLMYGEIRRHEEFEHSKYYYEIADVERARQMYELFAAECLSCLEQGLVLPAHDYVLKCSHTFNIMDARGAVGVTERQAYFRRMRDMAKRVAEAYLEQQKSSPKSAPAKTTTQNASAFLGNSSSETDTLLVEVGVEELPAADVDTTYAQLEEKVHAWLDELSIQHGEIKIFATPRRFGFIASQVAAMQPNKEEVVKGPPADRAFGPDGSPTPAAIGFATKNGISASDLKVEEIDNGKYVVARVFKAGRKTGQVVAEQIPSWINAIKFERSMKWNNSGVSFSRPIRWITALFGSDLVPCQYAGVNSAKTSRGLRPYDSPLIEIPSADGYISALASAGILLDRAERSAEIERMVISAANALGGQAYIDPGLLQEVTNLVEKPTVIVGKFNPEYLALPRDVLVSTMKKHQRYFPVEDISNPKDSSGNYQLLAFFIAIRNGDDQHIEVVAHGNEHVLGARFADANFFVREDVKKPLADFRDELRSLIFQTKLGSMLEKSDRIYQLAPQIGEMLGYDVNLNQVVQRAAYLSKADLTTQMVTEMTSLQGIIGREYALRSGEPQEVAVAIGEQYQLVPKTKAGVAIALADRVDTLVGLFSAGVIPSGAKDPFGLRRAAIGIVQPLLEHGLPFNLRDVVARAAKLQPVSTGAEVNDQVLAFLAGRLKVVLSDMGYRYDVVDAVLEVNYSDPYKSLAMVRQLGEWVGKPEWSGVLDAYARCVRIIRSAGHIEGMLDTAALQEPAELKLLAKFQGFAGKTYTTVDGLLNDLQDISPAISEFFDKVLVMSDDPNIRINRLRMLKGIAGLATGVADLSKLEGF